MLNLPFWGSTILKPPDLLFKFNQPPVSKPPDVSQPPSPDKRFVFTNKFLLNTGSSLPTFNLMGSLLTKPASIKPLQTTQKINFDKPVQLQEGVQMFMPQNPVKPDGTVDVIIQFRGVVPQRYSESSVNAIVIACETEGLSQAMMQKFGASDFAPKILDKALQKARQKYGPNIQQGRLAMGSFSAGYAPLAVALSNPAIRAKTDAVIVLDGIHYGKKGKPDPLSHQPFVDFAREAANGNKMMVITHSSITPSYSSSTDAANYIMSQAGAQRTSVVNNTSDGYKTRYGNVPAPSSRADLNGFHVEGYTGDQAKNHVEQIDNLGNVWNRYLAPRW